MIREVERNRHVGLPHAALHVVHGKGVGAGGDGFFCAFVFKCYCIVFLQILNRFASNKCFVHHAFNFIACFYIADIRGINKLSISILAKLQQAGRFAVFTANVQRQVLINVDPYVVVAREEELDGNLACTIGAINLAIIGQRELELQFCAKAVVVCRRLLIRRILVEGEETVGSIILIIRVRL